MRGKEELQEIIYHRAAINYLPAPILALLFLCDPAVEILLGIPAKAIGFMPA